MKAARFDYALVDTPEQACDLLAEYGDDAQLIAGGQSLVPMLNMRIATPKLLIDISRCETLDYVRATNEVVEVGAMFRQAGLERWHGTRRMLPLLHMALPYLGHTQTRARGTVGGSIAHADPSAEIPLVLATRRGVVHLRSVRGTRQVSAQAFFLGALDTDCAPDELVLAVSFPKTPLGTGVAFIEESLRHGDFALIALGAEVRDGRVTLGIAGLQDCPLVVEWALDDIAREDQLGERTSQALANGLTERLHALSHSLEVLADHHADEHYRRRLLVRRGRQVIVKALERAQGNAATAGPEEQLR